MKTNPIVRIDNIPVQVAGERNLLEVIRKAHIDLPTFCYHSEISVYGACRMCMVEVEGRGLVPACSTPPEDGMVVRTSTKPIRDLRKVIVELMLANHDNNCTTCPRSGDCKLQRIASQLGVRRVRFKHTSKEMPPDLSSPAIQRDPNKCVLCGDCVRVCSEIQSVGALDFAFRGADARVLPCFNKGLGEVECVNCGQCVKVCPVGALTPRSEIESVWQALHNQQKTVIVSIAPAVRVAVGEAFGFKPGETTSGQIVASLRLMGFDKVFDTSFAADMTVIEEANEFLERYEHQQSLPQFTSCCPAWVKFAEQYYPEMLTNLSTCKSPQQMFGAACKEVLSKEMSKSREDIVVVSIMPCTAKKLEAKRPEMAIDGNPDVDHVITTQEFIQMIKESGIAFEQLDPESFDMPFGFTTGAGVIFGASGGVSEAVLRYAAGKLGAPSGEFRQLRGEDGVRTTEVTVGDVTLKLAVVSGLSNARQLMDRIRNGEVSYDLIEVMACCGGCVNGGGQPVHEHGDTVQKRAKGLFNNDKMLPFHRSQDNPHLRRMYDEHLTGHRAHELLHTRYANRKRIENEDALLSDASDENAVTVTVCFGTSCFLRGAQKLYTQLTEHVAQHNLNAKVAFKATFCQEQCQKGPVVVVGDERLTHCTLARAVDAIERHLSIVK